MKKVLSVILIAALLFNAFAMLAFAQEEPQSEEKELYSIEISGTADYEKSYELFDRINDYRSENGFDTFTADKELIDAAMQRAAECAVFYSSARPSDISNKESFESVMPENFKNGIYEYENAVFNSIDEMFNESKEKFYNFLSTGYKTVGIGIVYHNGIYFCVVLSSNVQGVAEENRTLVKETKTFDILCEKQLLEKIISEPEMLTLEKGMTDSVFFECVNKGWTDVRFIINPKIITVSDENIISAEIMQNAVKVTALEAGSGEIGIILKSVDDTSEVSGNIIVNVSEPPAKALLGDVNGDGRITVVDAKWILQILAGTRKLTDEMYSVIDMNNDEKISAVDAKYVLQTVSGTRDPVYLD